MEDQYVCMEWFRSMLARREGTDKMEITMSFEMDSGLREQETAGSKISELVL